MNFSSNLLRSSIGLVLLIAATPSFGQAPGGAPSVGVEKVEKKPITESTEFIGRIEAINRVAVVARVTAFVDKVNFVDGTEVKKGDLLYQLERGPFQADLDAKKAVADQFEAQLVNANVALERSQALLKSNAGAQATVDAALATQKALAAQVLGAKASVAQSQINLDYTTIASPIDGKIGRTAITLGNVVSPSSGTLVTIIGQDPMYVTFPVSVRTQMDLRKQYAAKGGFDAVKIRVKLPNGELYGSPGKLDFIDNTVQASTDTIILRGTIPNPLLKIQTSRGNLRELSDNEFVTVSLEGVTPVEMLVVARSAILMDQQSDYVYVVDAQNKAQRRSVKLGQSTPAVAAVLSGLQPGEMVVTEGVQRVKAGAPVSPSPATPTPATTAPGQ
ncbi:efflux RND transporter periplasmic adaptor subunit [Beijerinckia sp. L45]|uniref:efflux RND transporter periplasmic adaptor subunit n=1 Tax=Beijerinckia sp. L45 TaxID=1641855 RepID=UPI001FEEA8ED|nr:efflux RND transporter periplasmic adaptor subunit [Beijerinckia sp. L45]